MTLNSHSTELDFTKLKPYIQAISVASKILDIDKAYSKNTSWPPDEVNTLNYEVTGYYAEQKTIFIEMANCLLKLEDDLIEARPASKIYVPILRTARALLPEQQEEQEFNLIERRRLNKIFAHTISKSYGINQDLIEIQTGLDLYSKINKNRNDSKENRILFDKFEEFISNNFFQGKDFEIVARYAEPGEEEHLHISINNVEHEIHFLGDGIQALITLLYPVFLAKPESWVFIEEPEVHLHPGMQRLFIETLLNDETIKGKKLTIFLTTHSNHLFDIAVDNQQKTSIFAFQKIQEQPPKFLLSHTNSGQLKILNLLEVSNSSVFMANCAIWVEGPTDRIYLRKYLDLYLKEKQPGLRFHEDLEYCFFEYAGSNLSHYLFSDDPEKLDPNEAEKINAWFLSNRIFLIADDDNGKEKKHSELLKQQNENFHYQKLEVREIENLLSHITLISQLPNIFGKWGKTHRKAWSIETTANPLNGDDYKKEYLASFLISRYPAIKFPKKFQGESGTLNSRYKIKLAQQVAMTLLWSDMSEEAQLLAEKLFEFIVRHNPILNNLLKAKQ